MVNDGLVGVPIPCSSRVGYPVAKRFEARLGGILHHLIDFCDLQTVGQVPLEQRRDEEDLFPNKRGRGYPNI